MAKLSRDVPILAFKSQQAFDAWLASQPADCRGLWLKIAKKSSGLASISRDEAVDAALCHGWIDGQLDRFDDAHWLIRFTPRQSTSKWSEKNRARALELVALGRMRPAGSSEIERARKDGRWNAAYAAQSTAQVPDDLKRALSKSKKAKAFFETLDSKNRFAILYRIYDAKKPETRLARIEKFVAMLAAGETLHPQRAEAPKRARTKT
ncbi:MAG TPA: YdeI/OmpD-associated family protein [Bradyrhizobium sp.]|uniref:YdeI/OmpD-associated family protein n=1 Tax=Bradyrhizobium sp. TaxID=376 RepID=UPI002CAD2029|nr:YdeI/OmpD-associated family protein [Bradyrhizobium sp.]HLZ03914.1 YdeI/OmpD-associated family protein [Bradyrhizobium sp.]